MYLILRKILRLLLGFMGLGLVKSTDLASLRKSEIEFGNLVNKLPFWITNAPKASDSGIAVVSLDDLRLISKSENGQDLFAIMANSMKHEGLFLEIGAFDGITFSNTYLLEKRFGWTGLLVECIPTNFRQIVNHRECNSILAAATPVDEDSVEVYEHPAPNLSRVKQHGNWSRLSGRFHSVPGISINTIARNILKTRYIDFLSIDIEGSELAVLQTVNYAELKFGAICVEHNFLESGSDIVNLLTSNGYRRINEEYSGNDFWFIPKDQSW